ncbi:class I glutamine amidotransferase-like protein [Chaetomium fimeti]|uniref:Class I glutamine amidotransferase-like protein n=1 Tax=Chaetomium fimeti TaxID=1854472 RepID=A0AAE0LUK3_9PEZI|nr:class I glutamine amidotransferase-like protein [Chaetomium fimeti]
MGSVPPPPPAATPIRLAILKTDSPIPAVSSKVGQFDTIFTTLLRAACASLDPPQTLESQLTLTAHDVVAAPAVTGEDSDSGWDYPDPDTIDAVLITGSRASAYDEDEWVVRLAAFVRRLLDEGRVRVIGVCFGHQIVARALGARVAPSPAGWELSVTEVRLSEEGRAVFGGESLNIYQTHRDVVLELPPGVVPLASTEKCPIQAMYIPRQLITVQGHPEYTPFIMNEMLQARHKRGAIADGPFEDAMKRVADKHDGVAIARVFLRFLRE